MNSSIRRTARTVLATLAAVGVAMGTAGAASACGFNCITSPVTAKPYEATANLNFTTSRRVKAKAYISARADFRGTVYASRGETFYSQYHTMAFPFVLEPNTVYYYWLRVEDEQGRAYVHPGYPGVTNLPSFRTLHRNLEVAFNSITVTDDSDFWSAGDLDFSFGVGNTASFHYYRNTSWSSGETRNPYLNLSAIDTPNDTVIAVNGFDDDADGFFDGVDQCGAHPGGDPATWGNGSNSLCEYSTAKRWVNLGSTAPGWHRFEMRSPALPRFTVYGYYRVSYFS